MGWLATISGIALIVIGALSRTGIAPFVAVAGLILLSIGLIAGAGSQGIERRTRGVLPYLGPSPLLVFVASIPVSLLAAIVIAIPLVALGAALDGPVGQLASVIAQSLVYAGLIRLLVVDTGALSWAQMGIRRFDRHAIAELAGGALWVLPVIPATSVLAFILVGITGVTPTSPLPPTGETSGLILQLIAGAVVAPLGEELLFRGFATTAWVNAVGYRSGLIRAALLFAVGPRPQRHRFVRRRGVRPRVRRVRVAPADRVRPRLAVPASRHDLGADRSAHGVQRDTAGPGLHRDQPGHLTVRAPAMTVRAAAANPRLSVR